MPLGFDVTLPPPVPVLVTVRRLSTNVAVTVFAVSIVSEHVPVPVQSPPQPVNALPFAGVAVRTTGVLAASVSLQSLPQLMPAGADVTVPPFEAFTVSVTGLRLNVAFTLFIAFIVTAHEPVPVQLP